MQTSTITFSLLFVGSLHASLLTSVSAHGDYYDGFGPAFGCSDSTACSVSPPGNASHFAEGAYSATAQYGVLDVRSFSDTYTHAELWGNASASFTDTLLLTGGQGAGAIVFGVEYWGLLHGDYCGDGYTCEGNTRVDFGDLHVHPGGYWRPGTVYDVSYSFTFGEPLTISGSASSFSTAYNHEFEDLSAHFQIDSAKVFVGGNELSGYSASAASGATYPFIGDPPADSVAVPEPAVGGMILAALAFLSLRRAGALVFLRSFH